MFWQSLVGWWRYCYYFWFLVFHSSDGILNRFICDVFQVHIYNHTGFWTNSSDYRKRQYSGNITGIRRHGTCKCLWSLHWTVGQVIFFIDNIRRIYLSYVLDTPIKACFDRFKAKKKKIPRIVHIHRYNSHRVTQSKELVLEVLLLFNSRLFVIFFNFLIF